MSVPKHVTDTIAELRSERLPLSARLDAIDLAIDNLSRVFGINGAPQPLPLDVPERRKKPRIVVAGKEVLPTGNDLAAAVRREQVLAALGRAPAGVGLTGRELSKATPKMSDKERSNCLQRLKAKGQIRRSGNAWIKVTEAA